tara:strand:+ start:2071 stop:5136 length:3066 start_codon:yes stop_codon:yes gene_type:complete
MNTSFKRKPVKLDTSKEITFQAIQWDFDNIYDDSNSDSEDNHSFKPRQNLKIRIYGVTEDGDSISVVVNKFNTFFYVKLPNKTSPWKKSELSDTLKKFKEYVRFRLSKGVKSLEKSVNFDKFNIVKKKPLYGYSTTECYFVKMVFYSSWVQKTVLQYFQKDVNIAGMGKRTYETYESNLDPMLRFMHTNEIKPAGLIKIEGGKYFQKDEYDQETRCQIEIDVPNYKNVVPVNESKLIPIIFASFDIECTSESGAFPQADNSGDKIIQIVTTYYRYGDKEPFYIHAVVLDTCTKPECVDLKVCENEYELLEEWTKSIQEVDPDILTGYNIDGFDLGYMWDRANGPFTIYKDKNGDPCSCVNKFQWLGRMKNKPSKLEESSFSSGAYGHTDFRKLKMSGRLQIDLLQVIKREHKLDSYKLDNVSAKFIGDKKDDVTPQQIFEYQKGSENDRRIILDYCVQDTKLPMRLINKLTIFSNMVEMSNVTLVPLEWLTSRGQQIKVFSQIVHEANKNNFLVPHYKNTNSGDDGGVGYVGATVLDALSGAYYEPITGLDFASLYPTIMRANNLCFSTLVTDTSIFEKEGVNKEDFKKVNWTINGIEETYYFYQKEVGLLPEILRKLLTSRKAAKKEMNKTTDPFKKAVLNGKQLALKVSCNSVYGFTGANRGMLPCLQIASSVTTLGRQMIDKSKKLAEERYTGSVVVYGDTDSIMVKFNTGETGWEAVKKSFEMGIEAGKWITEELNKDVTYKDIIDLEFEKVYWPYCLYSKKRYCGLMYEHLDKDPTIDIKGLQVVRRDNCELTKDVCNGIINAFLIDKDIDKAKKIVQNIANNLIENKIDVNKLVLSKSLNKHYKSDNLPHKIVAEKVGKRDPGNAPQSGDRIPYVFIKTANLKDKQFEKAEDPNWVIKNKLELDSAYYLIHQIKNPVLDLFSVIIDNPLEAEMELLGDAYMKCRNDSNEVQKLMKKLAGLEKEQNKFTEWLVGYEEDKKEQRKIESERKAKEKKEAKNAKASEGCNKITSYFGKK